MSHHQHTHNYSIFFTALSAVSKFTNILSLPAPMLAEYRSSRYSRIIGILDERGIEASGGKAIRILNNHQENAYSK